jgi:hypothetical protein
MKVLAIVRAKAFQAGFEMMSTAISPKLLRSQEKW